MAEGLGRALEGFWRSSAIAALLAAVVVGVLLRKVPARRFRRLGWWLPIVAAVCWGTFAIVMLWAFWESYYSGFYAPWSRWAAPSAALVYGLAALGMRWLAVRLPGHPTLNFCLLGGVESELEHLFGIYRLRILETVPSLRGVTIAEVLVFAFFEYVIYWGIVLGLAALLRGGWEAWSRRRRAARSTEPGAQA
ncbi:MAG TPA: hypothetical protein VJ123_03935 [Anaerolineales bacterium]|nr:hypothetical protein [Anaerolineales bacterium]